MNCIQNSSKLVVLALVLIICAFGCKSKKKAMEASNASKEKARIEQEAALRKEEETRKREAEEIARREREEEAKRKESEVKESAPKVRLGQYFEAIASSSNITAANNSINEALALFASPQTPVLIVISEYGGQKDYDRPTTIKEYLHYLKDQKKNINAIVNLKVDGTGKVTEVELKKPL